MRIFLLVFIFGLTAHASNWISKSDLLSFKADSSHIIQGYVSKAICETSESGECLDRGDQDTRKIKIGPVDDVSKPIFRAVNDSTVKVSCLDFSDCQTKAMGVFSSEGYLNRVCLFEAGKERWDEKSNHPSVSGISGTGDWFYWCELETGNYEQKDGIVAEDQSVIDAVDSIEAAAIAKKAALVELRRLKSCGESVVEEVRLLINLKGWGKAKYESLSPAFEAALKYAQLGQISFAKTEAEAYTPVPPDTTQADKDAIVALLDACLSP